MLDYLVLYQSESGNTKKIAASIFSRLPGKIRQFRKPMSTSSDSACTAEAAVWRSVTS